MAIFEDYNVDNPTKLMNFLKTYGYPDFIGDVTLNSNGLFIYDTDGNLFVKLIPSNKCYIYKTSDSSSEDESFSSQFWYRSDMPNPYAAKCDGGIMFFTRLSGTQHGGFIITKNQKGKIAVIVSSDDKPKDVTLTTDVHAVAFGDNTGAVKTRTFSASSQNQTQFVPFTTYANQNEISYTPNAYFMPVGEYYDLNGGKFRSGNYVYVTNGYWAIKDAPIEIVT